MHFAADLHLLDEILVYIRNEALELSIPAKAIHRMEVACEEAIVNIISYAHPNPTNGLTVDCRLHESHFEVLISDEGPPFNPLEVKVDPQKDRAIHERKIGGLGIYLIRKLVDEAIYMRDRDCNTLRLILRLEVED